MTGYWLVKSEPDAYSWEAFVREGRAMWDGVRNYQARNHLRAMRRGDSVLFYHSNVGQEVVGIARVLRESYPDPTAKEPGWVVVDLEPVRPLPHPVPLKRIKQTSALKNMALVRQGRLSVMPLSASQYRRILRLGGSSSAP